MSKGLKLYVDRVDSHVHMRVFCNGGLAGKLVLRAEEFFDCLDNFSLAVESLRNTHDLGVFKTEGKSRERLRELMEKWDGVPS